MQCQWRFAPFWLCHEFARIAEQPHPAAVLASIARAPRILHVTKRPLRMRHRYGYPAVSVGQRCNSMGRPAGIIWIGVGNTSVVMHVPEAYKTARRTVAGSSLRGKLGMSLAMRHGDRQERS